MFYTYILYSKSSGKYYIGSTENLDKRLQKHNSGGSKWTKRYKPWEIVWFEEFTSRELAYKREIEIKKYKGGNSFKQLVSKTTSR